MSYRVLCDENVEPDTVGKLETAGKTATHVNNEPGRRAPDEAVAAYAREHDHVVLTNDTDFLGHVFPGIKVLFFPDNRASAHELAARIVELQEYFPRQCDLLDEIFLTDRMG